MTNHAATPASKNSKCATHSHVGIVKRQNPWFHPIPGKRPEHPQACQLDPVYHVYHIPHTSGQGIAADL